MRLRVLVMKSIKRYKIGELVRKTNERNTLRLRNFCGLNINKEFMPTIADTNGVDESKYKIVRKNMFVFSGMQTGRDQCIRISMYRDENIAVISPAYTTFEIANENLILSTYFFMLFLSTEKDRYGAFCSDASIRSNLDWDRFCDIELDIPSIEIQRKYVSIYEGLLANLKSYEDKLEDLKLVCDGYIEDLKKKYSLKKIGSFIELTNRKNVNSCLYKIVGISNTRKLIPSESRTKGVDITNYLILSPGEIAYSPIHINDGSIALNDTNDSFIISPIYATFKCNSPLLNTKYLFLWFSREEFTRYCWFNAFGTARDTFDWSQMINVKIPIPPIEIQNSIVAIFNAFNKRKGFIEKLKNTIKDICPILIKGSLEEARSTTHG